MEQNSVSYIAFESVQIRLERINKRLWILCIILIIALIGSNAGWFYYESQWIDEVSVEQEAEWESGNVIINGTGEVNTNGESKTKGN